MAQSLEVQSRIALLRQKVLDGSITPDELKEGLALVRQDRQRAGEKSATKTRTAKAPINSDDLLKELDL